MGWKHGWEGNVGGRAEGQTIWQHGWDDARMEVLHGWDSSMEGSAYSTVARGWQHGDVMVVQRGHKHELGGRLPC